jgi:small redox-active disulfide protein 2
LPWATSSTPSSRSEIPLTHFSSKEAIAIIIKILGSGCTNCVNLERVTRQAVADLGIDAQFEKVTDYPAIIGYGVMSTPGLVVDEKVVLSGRVPTAAKVRELLESLTSTST